MKTAHLHKSNVTMIRLGWFQWIGEYTNENGATWAVAGRRGYVIKSLWGYMGPG